MKEKLKTLAEIEGYDDPMDLLEVYTYDSVCPGICRREGCEYTTTVEPDQRRGYCEECGTQTVASALVLAGLI